jgi:hypothetical protein
MVEKWFRLMPSKQKGQARPAALSKHRLLAPSATAYNAWFMMFIHISRWLPHSFNARIKRFSIVALVELEDDSEGKGESLTGYVATRLK